MRIALLALLVWSAALPEALKAQTQQRISLKIKQATISQVITRIKETTRYNFFYRVEDLPSTPLKDYEFRDATQQQVMDKLLDNTSLVWSFNKQTIVISRKPQTQQATGIVTGTILDEEGNPLDGASVVIAGTTRGVVTGADGRFSIDRIAGRAVTLRVAFIGNATREVTVEPDRIQPGIQLIVPASVTDHLASYGVPFLGINFEVYRCFSPESIDRNAKHYRHFAILDDPRFLDVKQDFEGNSFHTF